MVDNPDKLCAICLRKILALLKYEELRWKKQVEECVEQVYRIEKSQSISNDHRKRKYPRTDDEPSNSISHLIDFNTYERKLHNNPRSIFLKQFLHGIHPLNSTLSERLANELVRNNQLNDFTLTLLSSNITCLKRLTLNVKYLSRLQCHRLNQYSSLIELKILFKEFHSTRMTNESFYQYICPSIESNFEEIYSIYAPLIFHHLHCQSSNELNGLSHTNRYLFQRSPTLSEGFSQQKLFHTILNDLHPLTYERLKTLHIAHYKFFAAYHSTATRKHSLVDMSPLTKW